MKAARPMKEEGHRAGGATEVEQPQAARRGPYQRRVPSGRDRVRAAARARARPCPTGPNAARARAVALRRTTGSCAVPTTRLRRELEGRHGTGVPVVANGSQLVGVDGRVVSSGSLPAMTSGSGRADHHPTTSCRRTGSATPHYELPRSDPGNSSYILRSAQLVTHRKTSSGGVSAATAS